MQRHERKYFISYGEYMYMRRLLGSVLKRDSHQGADGDYWIRSLYFDTPDDLAYEEKIMGVSERCKLRLRIYSLTSDAVKLEIKQKKGQYGSSKDVCLLTKKEAQALCAGEFNVLTPYLERTAAAKAYTMLCCESYRPVVLVEYDREAYLCPTNHIRVTFDKNVRAIPGSVLFAGHQPLMPLIEEPLTIMEVKYDEELPPWLAQILGSCKTLQSSISKYCLAREKFL